MLKHACYWPKYEDAYYLAGYAVECGLKACIAKRIRKFDFPDKKLIADSYTHNLEQLLNVSGLKQSHGAELSASPDFKVNWAVVRDWSENDRYAVGRSRRGKGSVSRDHGTAPRNSDMAEETLVKEALTPEMIRAGRSVLENLDRKGLPVDAALWLYRSEANDWRLILATRKVRLDGPRRIYRRILEVLAKSDASGLSLEDVSVVDTKDPFIESLRSATKAIKSASPMRFSKNIVNGQYIEDALVYRH